MKILFVIWCMFVLVLSDTYVYSFCSKYIGDRCAILSKRVFTSHPNNQGILNKKIN